MLKRCRSLAGSVALLSAGLLSGCAGPLIEDPTGIAFVDHVLAFLANPNVTYLLFVLGLLALIAEVASPGAVLPGWPASSCCCCRCTACCSCRRTGLARC